MDSAIVSILFLDLPVNTWWNRAIFCGVLNSAEQWNVLPTIWTYSALRLCSSIKLQCVKAVSIRKKHAEQ